MVGLRESFLACRLEDWFELAVLSLGFPLLFVADDAQVVNGVEDGDG